ncbi:MAG: hypothetical protein ACR2NM_07005 [Bythopirellula sp.]
MIRPLWYAVTLSLLVVGSAQRCSAMFGNMTSRLPSDTNTLVLIDVEKLKNTSLAAREGWAEKIEEAFQQGLLAIPPDATQMVAASKTNFSDMSDHWSLALMNLSEKPSFPKLAAKFSGSVDNVEGKEIVLLPGDIFAMEFSDELYAVGSPAVRQDVARWIKQVYGNRTGKLSDYMEEAKKFAENGSPIIMAMDLDGAVSREQVDAALDKIEVTHNLKFDRDKTAKILASIRGISLGVTVNDKRVGAVKVDFGLDVAPIRDVAKPILLAALSNHGAVIDEFYDWKVSTSGKSVQLTGVLEQSGMRRIMSLLEAPPSLRYAERNEDNPASKQELILQSTKMYFKSVQSLLDDLAADKKRRKNMAQLSVWFRKYADRIDDLPMLNVDPEMLDYGLYISTTLRGGANTVTEAGRRKMVRQQEVPDQYDVTSWSRSAGRVGGGWRGGGARAYSWNGWSANRNDRAKMNIQAKIRMQENFAGGYSATQTLQEISEATAQIRRFMTEKYSTEF